MPVEFLTDEQAEAYGKFAEEPTRPELERFFFLDGVDRDLIARLSPLKHANLNVLGRYSFTASTPAAGALRPLRDPDARELDEDDDGAGLAGAFPAHPGPAVRPEGDRTGRGHVR
ncbi:hypothetical protein ACFW9S_35800 [Streptomyces anulatus]|uniref:hypothetical protein n=1 Tax=Streptomyces anulatus TaxID=1892 RepID=UPI00368F9895